MVQFGNLRHPPYIDRLIPDWQTSAWDDLGPRKVVGCVTHSMLGTLVGTDGYFRRGGASTGLTDYGVDLQGVTYRWNDPTGAARDGVSPDRSGWANGGSDGLEGDGVAFYRRFGANGVNRLLVSIEHEDYGDPNRVVTDRQLEASCRLQAYWFDQAKVPWDAYPLNPEYGIVTDLEHWEFATKACPFDRLRSITDKRQNRVRAILKAAQTADDAVPSGLPPVAPIKPRDVPWPNGWTDQFLSEKFGKLPQYDASGKLLGSFAFNPRGAISNAWAFRGGVYRYLPTPRRWLKLRADADGPLEELVLFDGSGGKDWLLWKPAPNAGWRWVG